MTGKLKGSKVIVEDEKEGNRIYNKGYFGKPISGGGLELNLLEAVYLVEADRLNILGPNEDEIPINEVIKNTPKDRFLVEYPLYKDMRMRGYVVKRASDPVNFRVFPRGGGPGKTQTRYWIKSNTETDTFHIRDTLSTVMKVSQLKKIFLQGIVDEEGDVTYYKITTIVLKGKTPKSGIKGLKGELYKNKVIIDDDKIERLHEESFYGNYEKDRLSISLLEALYLSQIGILTLTDGYDDEDRSAEDLTEIGVQTQDNFKLRYEVYRDLRSKDLIPKTGFKYGAVFRAYEGDPDEHHAGYIVQPITDDFKCSWYEISRAVRVAHSVKKRFLFAVEHDDEIKYIKINRVTP